MNKIKKYTLLFIIILLTSCNSKKDSDWIYLFDGETTDGWRAYNGETIPDKWAAIDGNLTFDTELDCTETENKDRPNSNLNHSITITLSNLFHFV